MVHQLLWIEVLLKFSGGVVLLFIPISSARLLGLPHGNVGLWPRLLGTLLLGLAGAIFIEGLELERSGLNAGSLAHVKHHGLGLAGVAVINITAIFSMIALLMLRIVKTVRGIVTLWGLVLLLFMLVFFEIAAI